MPCASSRSARAAVGAAPPRSVAWTVAPAAVVLALQIGATAAAHAHHPADGRALDLWGYLLLTLGPALLLARHRWPREVLLGTLLVTAVYGMGGYIVGPSFAASGVALFAAITAGHRLTAYVCLGLGYGVFVGVVPLVRGQSAPGLAAAIGTAVWCTMIAAVAEVARVRRAYAAAAAQRAAEAEHAREEQERRRAGEERLRIARELHDVLAHHISLMNVQAAVGLELMDGDPERARTALRAVKEASAEALGELRSVLTILRGEREQPPRTPTVGLAGLDALVERAAASGLRVRTQRVGAPVPLAAPVDLAAYRIVQESLTNVVRHAGATAATVRLGYGPRWLTVTITDDGCGASDTPSTTPFGVVPSTAAGGDGLAGMRERAMALGGRLVAGTLPEGGFRVEALLPLDPERRNPRTTVVPVTGTSEHDVPAPHNPAVDKRTVDNRAVDNPAVEGDTG